MISKLLYLLGKAVSGERTTHIDLLRECFDIIQQLRENIPAGCSLDVAASELIDRVASVCLDSKCNECGFEGTHSEFCSSQTVSK